MWRGWTLHSSAVVGVMLATLLPTPILATQAGTMGFDGVAAGLSSPPPGVKPWAFQYVGGHPIFSFNAPVSLTNSAKEKPRQAIELNYTIQRFFELIRAPLHLQNPADESAKSLAVHFLTSGAAREIVDTNGPARWHGRNEFEQEDSRRLFETKYKPLILKLVPKAPFTFRYSTVASVEKYDETHNGFPLTIRDGDRSAFLLGRDADFLTDFAPPDQMLWRVPREQAPGALRQIDINPENVNGRRGLTVMVIADIEVKSVEGATGKISIGLDALSLYTPDGRTKLYDVPVRRDATTPFLNATIPTSLQVSSPAPLDKSTICAELLSVYGARTPTDVFQTCWNDAADRDAKFYRSDASTASFGSADARRPFFPRGGAPLNEQNRAAFLRWASAYAAGLADHTVVSLKVLEPNTLSVALPWWPTPASGNVKSLMDSEGILLEQQLGLMSPYDKVPVIFVLPNSSGAYATLLPPERAKDSSVSYSAEAIFRLGKVRAQAYDNGQPALLIQLIPQSVDISSAGEIIYSHSYDDVPALANAFAASPAPTAQRTNAGPFPLDGAVINLLTASAAGDNLPKEALANVVSRRWVVENSGYPPSGERFFVVGKGQPTPEEAAGLGAQFVAWAKSKAPRLPARVTLRQKLTLRKGQGISWSNLDCFQGSYESLMNDSNLMMGINSALGSPQRKVANGAASRQEKLQYAAGQAALVSMGLLKPAGVTCNKGYVGDGTYFRDAVTTIFRFDQELPSSDIDILGDSKDVVLNMTLDITGVDWPEQPPQAIDAMPADMQASLAQLIRISKPGVKPGLAFVTLDVRLVSAQVLDTAGKQLATLGPSSPSQLQTLVTQYRKLLAEPVAPPPSAAPPPAAVPPQAATQAYGPDLIGVRLGMSFEVAEGIVRKHMEVGQVLDGRRAFDNEIKSGFNAPLTSGKLFISKEKRELIALIDEPPAAEKRVVAAWRRIYAPPETYEPEELFSQIKEKYGPPKISGGYMGYWYKADMNCSWLLQVSPKPLAEIWMNQGQPANIVTPNRAAYSNAGPFFPIRFYDPLGQKPSGCGPVVHAAINKAQPPLSPMTELNMTLTDLDYYITVYSASRKLLQGQAAEAGPRSGGDPPAIKF